MTTTVPVAPLPKGEEEVTSRSEYLVLLRALDSNEVRLPHAFPAHAAVERLTAANGACDTRNLYVVCDVGIAQPGG